MAVHPLRKTLVLNLWSLIFAEVHNFISRCSQTINNSFMLSTHIVLNTHMCHGVINGELFHIFLHDYDKSETANDTRCSQVFEFSLIVFGDKIFVITVKGSNLPPLVLETRMLTQCQTDTFERWDLEIDPNSCFTD